MASANQIAGVHGHTNSNGDYVGDMGALGFKRPKLNPRQAMVNVIRKDAMMLQGDPRGFGQTDKQIAQSVAPGMVANTAAASQNISAANRANMAGQGFQEGAATDQAQAIAGEAQKANQQLYSDALSRNDAQVEQGVNRAMGELAAERAGRKANRQYWANFGLATAQTVGEVVGGIAK